MNLGLNENFKQYIEKLLYLGAGLSIGIIATQYLPKIYKEYKEKEKREILEDLKKEISKYLKGERNGSNYE